MRPPSSPTSLPAVCPRASRSSTSTPTSSSPPPALSPPSAPANSSTPPPSAPIFPPSATGSPCASGPAKATPISTPSFRAARNSRVAPQATPPSPGRIGCSRRRSSSSLSPDNTSRCGHIFGHQGSFCTGQNLGGIFQVTNGRPGTRFGIFVCHKVHGRLNFGSHTSREGLACLGSQQVFRCDLGHFSGIGFSKIFPVLVKQKFREK